MSCRLYDMYSEYTVSERAVATVTDCVVASVRYVFGVRRHRTCHAYMVVHATRTWSYMPRVHGRRFVTASAHTSAVSPPYDVAVTNVSSITIVSSLPTSRMRRCIR